MGNKANEIPDPPKGLQARGSALWRSTLGEFELLDHELTIMVELCRTADTVDALQEIVDAEGMILPWGDGCRAHPALVEARQQRLVLARLLATLRIPADEADKPQRSSADRSELRERSQSHGGTPGARGVYAIKPRGPM